MWKPIPPSPSLHANSAAIVSRVTGLGTPQNLIPGVDSSTNSETYLHPTYYATAEDPLFTIAQATGGYSSSWWNTQVRIPQEALPADGTDHHIAAIQPDGTEYFVWDTTADLASTTPITALPEGGGTIYGRGFGKYQLHSNGLKLGTTGNATAAHFPTLWGEITVAEMYARVIPHALFMVTWRTNGTTVHPSYGTAAANSTTLTGSHAFPISTVTVASTSAFASAGNFRLPNGSVVAYTGKDATHFTGCTGGTGTHNGSTIYEEYFPPCGARFYLDMTDAEIDALSTSWWNKVLFRAMAHYGMFVGDTGGSTWGTQIDSTLSQYLGTGIDPWRVWSSEAGLSYYAPDDVYVWNFKTISGVDWATDLKVLDWNDPGNY